MATGAPSLQDFVDQHKDLVRYFYNETQSPHSSYRSSLNPAPTEWSNWRDEQRAWREAAILFDQSHHMPEIFVEGRDAPEFLNRLGVNSFENFVPGKAKQFIGCNWDGRMLGECVVYMHSENKFELVSGMHFQNWISYHAATGNYDMSLVRDYPTSENPGGRVKFRFGMDGPNAEAIFKEVVEGQAPEIAFFNTARVRIAGCEVLALRHGMAGHKGVELSGAFKDGQAVREALLKAGEKHGLRPGGTTTYFSACAEGGWMAYPTPAVYTGEAMRPYREWLPGDSWETRVQLGGSFRSPDIADYYVTPWDMGYDRLVKFDHDFIGREALEALRQGPRRTAVSLVWNKDDIVTIVRSMLEPGLPYKQINFPAASYSFQQNDEVRDARGDLIGIAAFSGYTLNEKEIISLAMVDEPLALSGTEVLITWGEPDGGSRKRHVERHRQMQVRATIAQKPYARAVQRLRGAALSHAAAR